jgi:hypothetical protein
MIYTVYGLQEEKISIYYCPPHVIVLNASKYILKF